MEEVIWSLPAPSQEFMQGPQILVSQGRVILRWDAEDETGSYERSSAEFAGVESVTFTAHSSCAPDQARAYDRLVKVEPSGLLSTLIYGSCSSLSRHLVGVGVPALVSLLSLVLVVAAP
jgi:hypothetical protein